MFSAARMLVCWLAMAGTAAAQESLQHAMVDPTLSVRGTERGELDDTYVGFTLLGLGLTYYLPLDVYLTAVLGASVASSETPEYEEQSETGWGGALDVGGEWHVGWDGGSAWPAGSSFTRSQPRMTMVRGSLALHWA